MAETIELPPGVKLVRTLRGHTNWIGRIAWSPDGRWIASPSADGTVRLWDAETGECAATLKHGEEVLAVAFAPTRKLLLASAGGSTSSHSIKLWDCEAATEIRTLGRQADHIAALAFDSAGSRLISGGYDGGVNAWEVETGKLQWGRTVEQSVSGVSLDRNGHLFICHARGITTFSAVDGGHLSLSLPNHGWTTSALIGDRAIASTGVDQTIKISSSSDYRLSFTLEGHTAAVVALAATHDGALLASKGVDPDCTIRVWDPRTGSWLATLQELTANSWASGLQFHPSRPILASVGSDPGTPSIGYYNHQYRDRVIHLWEFDVDLLLRNARRDSSNHYVNAKVVLLGDTGVGKSGLSLVLNGQPFEATESTAGRRVLLLDSHDAEVGGIKQTRETLLWDLAGQPGYRVIHQLHLNGVAVALVVFDARSETDPLAGVRHWERALRLAQQRQTQSPIPMKKILVSARADRGTVSVSKERLEAILKEFAFDAYFETSAKEGWEIEKLRDAIKESIPWEILPEVTSTQLFSQIKSFLLEVKESGRLVSPEVQLYDEFARTNSGLVKSQPNLRDQFTTCAGRLENRDLIRRLSFGGYVLLQPELLDAYASAMVNAAKEEPDGLGSIAEEVALSAQFYVPKEQKVTKSGEEQLLVHATVEELARHDLALRESASDGRYLVFLSQFNRDYEDAPEPKGKAVAITFDGPVQSLYSTLTVRLGHSTLFSTSRSEMWRNAAMFTATAGGKCGLYLHEFEEGRGRLILFYASASDETRFHFEEFVWAHVQQRALEGTAVLVRFFVCGNCGDPVPDAYVRRLRDRNLFEFNCPCGATVSLTEPRERLQYASKVETMERSADRQRGLEVFVQSARGETITPSFMAWAGGERVTLAVVFTDVVESTKLGEQMKDERMNEVRRAHFVQSRKLIEKFGGREIKTIGDSFMTAFKSVEKALDYAMALQAEPGHPKVKIRAGIHIGSMSVEENDIFGGAVNFAARVIGAIKEAEIWLSERAKEDIDKGGTRHARLAWKPHHDVEMKGFHDKVTLWSL